MEILWFGIKEPIVLPSVPFFDFNNTCYQLTRLFKLALPFVVLLLELHNSLSVCMIVFFLSWIKGLSQLVQRFLCYSLGELSRQFMLLRLIGCLSLYDGGTIILLDHPIQLLLIHVPRMLNIILQISLYVHWIFSL